MTDKPKATPQEQFCDQAVDYAARLMLKQDGVDLGLVLDRMLTFCVAHMCLGEGSVMTAEHFRDFADKIDAGLFHRITGEGRTSTDH